MLCFVDNVQNRVQQLKKTNWLSINRTVFARQLQEVMGINVRRDPFTIIVSDYYCFKFIQIQNERNWMERGEDELGPLVHWNVGFEVNLWFVP